VPLENRVFPDGALVATPERGLLMGNRGGQIHDVAMRNLTRRRWTSRAWICCRLEFKGWYKPVWSEGYSQLFFLDEVTALAAGHRPCYECRRADAIAYATAVASTEGLAERPTAPELDRRLHAERLDGREKRVHRLPAVQLPDGAMLRAESGFAAVRGDRLLGWTPGGYVDAGRRPRAGKVDVLTPPTSLAALAGGFVPLWHPGCVRHLAGSHG
jgi:hypothetical protein